jgi:hypothetical protein
MNFATCQKTAASWAPGSKRDQLALTGLLGLGGGVALAGRTNPNKGLLGQLVFPQSQPQPTLFDRAKNFVGENKLPIGLVASGIGGSLLASRLLKYQHERKLKEEEHQRRLQLIKALSASQALKPADVLSVDGLSPETVKHAGLWGAGKALSKGVWEAGKQLYDPQRLKNLVKGTGRAIRGTGLYVDKGLGLHQFRNSRQLYNTLMGRKGLRQTVNDLTAAGNRAGVGPSMLSFGGLMNPLSTLSAKFTRPGYLRWLTEQASGNTKQWQRLAATLPPDKVRRIESMLLRQRVARDPYTGQLTTAAKSVARTSPNWRHLPVELAAQGLFYTPLINATMVEPGKKLLGLDAPPPPEPQPTLRDRAVSFVAEHPYATAAGVAGAGALGYGLYRGLSGSSDPYARS